jgi:hypothetical protein
VNIRDNTELRPTYLEVVCRLTNGVANEARLVEQLSAVDALIRPVIAEEVPVLWEPREEDPLDALVPGTYASEVERMKTWMPARVAAVRTLIEADGIGCAPGCLEGESVACEHYGCPSIRTCTDGPWGACQRPFSAIVAGEDADRDGIIDTPPDSPAPITEPAASESNDADGSRT